MKPHEKKLWNLAISLDALYESPVDQTGKHIGPLVPYSGKDKEGRNLVGWVYFNFAMIEPHVDAVNHFAAHIAVQAMHKSIKEEIDVVVGIPDGGRTLGQMVAWNMDRRFIYPTKVPKQASEGAVKAEYDLVFKRHPLNPGDRVLVVDDVHNNFQQTHIALDSIAKTGARVVALASAMNRSPQVNDIHVPLTGFCAGQHIQVVSAIRRPLPEYEVSDPAVAEYYERGFIEKDVKANWPKLKKIMVDANMAQNTMPGI